MKISELVKTYKLLNDPNAPEWNIRFIGGALLALGIVAAAGFIVYAARSGEDAALPAAASAGGGEARACTSEEIAAAWTAYRVEHPAATEIPAGEKLPSGCVV